MADSSSIENTELYRRASSLADLIWLSVNRWPVFAKDTVGVQLARAMDSVAANLVEGDGRAAGKDAIRFFVFSRASAREARHWLRRAQARKLIDESQVEAWISELTEIVRMIHAIVRYREARTSDTVRETRSYSYGSQAIDPFVDDAQGALAHA